MSAAVAKNIDEVLEQLRRDPERVVEAELGGLPVVIRMKPRVSAADVFQAIGPWEGESPEELAHLLEEARRSGGSGEPPAL